MDAAACARRSATRPFAWSGTTTARRPQLETLRIKDDARGRAPPGWTPRCWRTAGSPVKMLVDRGFGADQVTMFTVDYELGGAAQAHDHPFEEAYFFLAGVCEGELDGQHYTLRAGDIVFASVGSVHGFYNVGTERVRWIETQAPNRRLDTPIAGSATGSGTSRPPGRRRRRWRTMRRRRGRGRHAGDRTGDRPPLRRRGFKVVLTGREQASVDAAVTESAVTRAGSPSTWPSRRRSRRRWPDSDPCGTLVLSAVDRDQNTVADYDIAKAIRLVTLKLVGYTEVVHTLLDACPTTRLSSLFGGMAKERPYPGVDDGHHGQRRRRRTDPDARRGARPRRMNSIHPGVVGDSPYWAGNPAAIAGTRSRTPTGRLATMADIVGATAFLLENLP